MNMPPGSPEEQRYMDRLALAVELVLNGMGFSGVVVTGIFEHPEAGLGVASAGMAADGAQRSATLVSEITQANLEHVEREIEAAQQNQEEE